MNEPDKADGQVKATPPAGDQRDGKATTLRERVRTLRLPAQELREPSGRPWLPWVLCLLLTASTLYLGVLAFGRSDSAPLPGAGAAAQPAQSSSQVSAQSGEVALESKGYIVPVHQIQVSPKVSGMVIELTFQEGKQVKKGDVLARLETVDYEADRDRAQAQLEANRQKYLELANGYRPQEVKQAKAELEEAEAQRDQLFLDWKRSASLNRQALPPREYEQSEAAYKAMDRRVARLKQAYAMMLEGPRRERVDQAKADVQLAQAELTKAQWRLDNCTVRAPVSGTILTKKAEEGNIVNPVAFNVAASLCDMADLSDLEVDLNIQERDVAQVFKGQRCRIRPEAFPDRAYEGHVSRLMPIADRAKGAVPVRVKVAVPRAEEGMYLKPEMSVLVSFVKKS